jgi:hypothetical protein
MYVTLIPLPSFLNAAILACRARQRQKDDTKTNPLEAQEYVGLERIEYVSLEAQMHADLEEKEYVGIVVILDRKAERRSNLLDDLVREGSSINDITRGDLLVALPGGEAEQRQGVDAWVLNPQKDWHGVGAPGLLLAGGDDSWAHQLWDLLSDEVERCQSEEDQDRIGRAVDQSASSVCDYLGLSEADIPCLVVFSLDDHRVFVFRYGGDADDPPYQLFKHIAVRRPRDPQPGWLTVAVQGVVQQWGLAEGPKPILAPAALTGWDAICYLPRQPGLLEWERTRD